MIPGSARARCTPLSRRQTGAGAREARFPTRAQEGGADRGFLQRSAGRPRPSPTGESREGEHPRHTSRASRPVLAVMVFERACMSTRILPSLRVPSQVQVHRLAPAEHPPTSPPARLRHAASLPIEMAWVGYRHRASAGGYESLSREKLSERDGAGPKETLDN